MSDVGKILGFDVCGLSKISGVPYRHVKKISGMWWGPSFQAYSPDHLPGIANLSSSLTINGTTYAPMYRYVGRDATNSKWLPDGYGTELVQSDTYLPYFETAPTLAAEDRAVMFTNAPYYKAGNTTTGDITTQDLVVEIVAQWDSTSAVRLLNKYASSVGYLIDTASSVWRLLIGDGSTVAINTGNLVDGCWYHVIWFIDRSGSGQAYVNGVASGSPVVVSSVGSMTVSGQLIIGGNAIGNNSFTKGVAYVSAWSGASWLDTHLQATIAAERFAKLTGTYANFSQGTAMPTTATRNSIAFLDKYEGNTQRLHTVGSNWIRDGSRYDGSETVYGVHIEPAITNLFINSRVGTTDMGTNLLIDGDMEYFGNDVVPDAHMEQAPIDVVSDGDMEAGTTSAWAAVDSTLSKDTTAPLFEGTQHLRITSTAITFYATQAILTTGKTYRITGAARSVSGGATPCVLWGTSSPSTQWTGTSATTWQRFDETLMAGGDTLYIGSLSSTGVVDFDDIKVYEQDGEWVTWSQHSSLVKSTEDPHSGSRCLRIYATQGGGSRSPQAYQAVLTSGKRYRAIGYARSDGTQTPRIYCGSTKWTGTTSTSWQAFDVDFVAGSANFTMTFSISDPVGTEYIEFDDIRVYEEQGCWVAGNDAVITKETSDLGRGSIQCLRITENTTTHPTAYQVVLISGEKYRITGYARSGGVSNEYPRIFVGGGGVDWTGTTSTDWQYFDFIEEADGANFILQAYNASGGTGEYCEFDQLSVTSIGDVWTDTDMEDEPVDVIVDGDMEAVGTGDWTIDGGVLLSKNTAAPLYEGIQHLRITDDGFEGYAYQSILTVGKTYRLIGATRTDGMATDVTIYNGATLIWTDTTSSTTWIEFDFYFVAAHTDIKFGSQGFAGMGMYVEFDAIQVLEQNGVWTAGNSAMLTKETLNPHSGTQCIRIAYDGTGGPYALQGGLSIGKKYRFRGYGRSGAAGVSPVIRAGGVNVWTGTTSLDWQEIDFTFTSAGTSGLLYNSNINTAGEWVEFDDITFIEQPWDRTYDLDDIAPNAAIAPNNNGVMDGLVDYYPSGLLSDWNMETTGTDTDVITDGDMEDVGTGSWTTLDSTLSKDTTAPLYQGTQHLRITSTANTFYAGQSILTAGKTYRVTGVARSADSGASTPRVSNSSGQSIWTGTNSTDWQYFDETFITTGAVFYIGSSNAHPGVVDFDFVRVLEQGVTDWTAGNNASLSYQANPHSGNQCLRIMYNGTAAPYAYQSILTTGQKYRARGWARSCGTGSAAPSLRLGGTTVWTGTSSTSWQYFDVTEIYASSGATTLYSVNCDAAGEYVEFNDISVVALDNFIPDGDMEEEGTDQWTASNNASLSKVTGYSGKALRVTYTDTNQPQALADGAITSGGRYRYTGKARGDGVSGVPLLYDGAVIWTGTSSDSWQDFDVSSTSSISTVRLYLQSGGTTYSEWDSLQVVRELIADNDMEAASTSGWVAANDAVLSKETGTRTGGTGTKVLRVAYDGTNDPYTYQVGTTTIGQRYRISGWCRSNGAATPRVSDSGLQSWDGTTSTDWQYFEFTNKQAGASVRFYAVGSSGYVEYDDVHVTPLESDYIADGSMEQKVTSEWTAGNSATLSKQTGTPYSGSQCLRVARNAVNDPNAYQAILTIGNWYRIQGYGRSDAADAAYPEVLTGTTSIWSGSVSSDWQYFDVVVKADHANLVFSSTDADDGTEYCEFDEITVKEVGAHGAELSATTTADEHAFSGYFKRGHSQWVKLENMTSYEYCYFDLYNGVVGTSSSGASGYIEYTERRGGSYRCILVETATAAAQTYRWIAANSDEDDNVISGDFAEPAIYAWGLQVEDKDYATSLIETDGATASRVVDVLDYLGNDGNAVDETKLTMSFNTLFPSYTQESTANSRLVGISDGGATADRFIIYMSGSNDRPYAISAATSGDTGQQSGPSALTDNTIHECRATSQTDLLETFVDDVSGGTDITSDVPDDLDKIEIGADPASAVQQPCALISDYNIYNDIIPHRNPEGFARFRLFDFSTTKPGVSNLPSLLTINSLTESPRYIYYGGDASSSGWSAASGGNDLSLTYSGAEPTYNHGSPLLGSYDDSVLFNGAQYFKGTPASNCQVSTEDFVLEGVVKTHPSGGANGYCFSTLSGTPGYAMVVSDDSVVVYVRNSSLKVITTGSVLDSDTWYHVMFFANRDEASAYGSQIYINGVATGSGIDISSETSSISSTTFTIGGRGNDSAFNESNIAYCAMYKRASWMQAGSTGQDECATVAKERFSQYCGSYPQIAFGTAVPSVAVRGSYAHLDKWEKNLSDNSFSYVEDFDNWSKYSCTISSDAIAAPDGTITADALISNTVSTSHNVSQTVTLSSGTDTVSVFAKKGDKDYIAINIPTILTGYFNLSNGTTISAGAHIEDYGNGWYLCSLEFSGDGTSKYITIYAAESHGDVIFAGDSSTVDVYLWGSVHQQGVTHAEATAYWRRKLYLTGDNWMRISHRRDSNFQDMYGFFSEREAENTLKYSQEFNNGSGWTPSGCSVSANAIKAPDDSLTADGIIGTAVDTWHWLQSASAVSQPTSNNVFSVFAKKGSEDWIAIETRAAAYNRCWFNLATGTVGTATGGTGYIEHWGNGWYRCILSWTGDGSTSAVGIFAANADNDATFLADGSSVNIYLWGAQHETTGIGYATSYIPTTSVAVTRSLDQLEYVGNDGNISDNQPKTTYFDLLMPEHSLSDLYMRLIDINDGGSASNRITEFISYGAGNYFATYIQASGSGGNVGGVAVAILDGAKHTIENFLENGACQIRIDGSSGASSNFDLPFFTDQIEFGSSPASSVGQPHGLIQDFRIYTFKKDS